MTAPARRSIADLDVPTEELIAQLAEQRHQVADLDADSVCRLPNCSPMCLPADAPPIGGVR